MIVLDTHIWVWWVHGDLQLTSDQRQALETHEPTGLGVSAISCWEVAKLVEYKRLNLTPEIVVESTELPGEFHKDPADQIIVATARVHEAPLLSSDEKIRRYPHVPLL